MVSVVVSAQNQHLKYYRSLGKKKIREASGLLPLEGFRLVGDALQSGAEPQAVMLREGLRFADFPFLRTLSESIPVITVEARLFDRTAFTESPQGILALVKKPVYTLDDVLAAPQPLVLVADGIQDPGNLGTMLRSAAAAGATGAVLLPGTVDAANPKVLRAAMGATFVLPVAECEREELLALLKARGIRLVSTGAAGAVNYDCFDWHAASAVVVGNEGAGISDLLAEAAHASVSIPMSSGVESLNAAIAVSVILFEAARARRLQQQGS
jgi:RNA methyltransferase, TrmH family